MNPLRLLAGFAAIIITALLGLSGLFFLVIPVWACFKLRGLGATRLQTLFLATSGWLIAAALLQEFGKWAT